MEKCDNEEQRDRGETVPVPSRKAAAARRRRRQPPVSVEMLQSFVVHGFCSQHCVTINRFEDCTGPPPRFARTTRECESPTWGAPSISRRHTYPRAPVFCDRAPLCHAAATSRRWTFPPARSQRLSLLRGSAL